MAKKRVVVGSVVKAKEKTKPDYVSLRLDNKDELIKALTQATGKALTLSLETKQARRDSLESAIAAGKISGELADKMRKDVEAIPDFIRFQLAMYVDKN